MIFQALSPQNGGAYFWQHAGYAGQSGVPHNGQSLRFGCGLSPEKVKALKARARMPSNNTRFRFIRTNTSAFSNSGSRAALWR